MATILSNLKEIESFLNKILKDENYQMYKAPPFGKQGIEEPKLVIPKVVVGNLPHTNFSLYGASEDYFQAPYIMIGLEDEALDSSEESMNILIQVCVYAQDVYMNDTQEEECEIQVPDSKGYEDCIRFLEWIRKKILLVGNIGGSTVEYPCRIGSYNTKELTYPYSFGYLSFSILSERTIFDRKKVNY